MFYKGSLEISTYFLTWPIPANQAKPKSLANQASPKPLICLIDKESSSIQTLSKYSSSS